MCLPISLHGSNADGGTLQANPSGRHDLFQEFLRSHQCVAPGAELFPFVDIMPICRSSGLVQVAHSFKGNPPYPASHRVLSKVDVGAVRTFLDEEIVATPGDMGFGHLAPLPSAKTSAYRRQAKQHICRARTAHHRFIPSASTSQ